MGSATDQKVNGRDYAEAHPNDPTSAAVALSGLEPVAVRCGMCRYPLV